MLSEIEARDLIPLSALNQYLYCPRRCYLIHVEGDFVDNLHTQRGTFEHERVDTVQHDLKEGVRIEFALPLWSHRLGLTGRADVVEFHPDNSLYPVEYKHGKRQQWDNDDIQLMAQAVCLEEMFSVSIESGAIYHQQSRRRREVVFDASLRALLERTCEQVHHLLNSGAVPKPIVQKQRCRGCSLQPRCQPELHRQEKNVRRLYAQLWQSSEDEAL